MLIICWPGYYLIFVVFQGGWQILQANTSYGPWFSLWSKIISDSEIDVCPHHSYRGSYVHV